MLKIFKKNKKQNKNQIKPVVIKPLASQKENFTNKDLINKLCEFDFNIFNEDCKLSVIKNFMKSLNIEYNDSETSKELCNKINKKFAIDLLLSTLLNCQKQINDLTLKAIQQGNLSNDATTELTQLREWWSKTSLNAINKAKLSKTTALDIIGEINLIKSPCENFTKHISNSLKKK